MRCTDLVSCWQYFSAVLSSSWLPPPAPAVWFEVLKHRRNIAPAASCTWHARRKPCSIPDICSTYLSQMSVLANCLQRRERHVHGRQQAPRSSRRQAQTRTRTTFLSYLGCCHGLLRVGNAAVCIALARAQLTAVGPRAPAARVAAVCMELVARARARAREGARPRACWGRAAYVCTGTFFNRNQYPSGLDVFFAKTIYQHGREEAVRRLVLGTHTHAAAARDTFCAQAHTRRHP